MSMETVTVHALGAKGDGVADGRNGQVFVPFTLPGDIAGIAREKDRGTLISLKSASSARVEPPCPHFGPDAPGGACGGCALQHMEMGAYRDWKRGLVVAALEAQRIETDVAPIVPCEPGDRRRIVLAVRKTERGVLLGLSQAGSHTIVPIETCLVATPAIAAALSDIRAVAERIASGTKPFRLAVTETASGLDLAASSAPKLGEKQRQATVETVLALRAIARLTVNGEVVIEPRKPLIQIGSVPLEPPPGAFLQASASAEATMAELVCDHLGRAKKTADLFAGCGAFALRIAARSAVHAVENDRAALSALDRATRRVQGLKPVSLEARDLFRSPLMPHELKTFEGVVFDPPRAGAEAQSRQLAQAKVTRVAAVSCNPVTLARDLAILIQGGFKLRSVTPIDQFLWSHHVEAVALLER